MDKILMFLPVQKTYLYAVCFLLLCISSLISSSVIAQTHSPISAPSPQVLFAQMDDPALVMELKDEETLGDLQNIEYEREALSMSKGILLSFIPGGGWGLLYAKKSIQAIVPFLLSAVGYGIGAVYLSGSFDETQQEVCVHDPSQTTVSYEQCSWGEGSIHPDKYNTYDQLSWNDINGDGQQQQNELKRYFETKGDYRQTTQGNNVNLSDQGLPVILGTYIATSLIGAIWSAVVISQHNKELRKKIESTAQAPIQILPSISYTGQQANAGLTLTF